MEAVACGANKLWPIERSMLLRHDLIIATQQKRPTRFGKGRVQGPSADRAIGLYFIELKDVGAVLVGRPDLARALQTGARCRWRHAAARYVESSRKR